MGTGLKVAQDALSRRNFVILSETEPCTRVNVYWEGQSITLLTQDAVLASDSCNILPNADVATINCYLRSLISQVDVFLNDLFITAR